MSPTERSLAFLRARGYRVHRAEHWNSFARIRVDAFGWIDILAIRRDVPGVLGVQSTSTGNLRARISKALALESITDWLLAGNSVEFHGWSRRGPHGKRKLWAPVIKTVTLGDFGEFVVSEVKHESSPKRESAVPAVR